MANQRDAIAEQATPSPAEPVVARPAISALAAGALTFTAVAAVLVLEIAAARLMAPYVGVSLTTYTGIIGVILGGISLGAWAGGRAADVWGPGRLLGPTFLLGGLAAMAAVPMITFAGSLKLGNDVGSILLLASFGFLLPATILSAVAPMIVRASIVSLATSGSLVGRLSAIGTLGALVGTFATGFVLLGLVPTRPLVIAVGAVLVLIGLILSWRLRAARWRTLAGGAAALLLGGLALTTPSPCTYDSAYYCITVTNAANSGEDPFGRVLMLDNLRHAYVNLRDPSFIPFPYIQWFAAASQPVLTTHGGSFDVLHMGGGGFSFPRYLLSKAPASQHLVLELDPEVLAVARNELGFTPDTHIKVQLGDARPAVAHLADDSFDLVVGDAFASLSAPWHLTTVEFLRDVDRVLRPDGLYLMNLIDYEPLRFARAETATLQQVFAHVAVISDVKAGGNLVR